MCCHSLTLAQGHSDMKIKTYFSQKLLGQIGSLILQLHPLDCWKRLYHQQDSFRFNQIILKLADKVDVVKILDELKKN